MLAHQEGNEFVNLFVVLAGSRGLLQSESHHHGLLYFDVVVETHRCCLQPHHSAEIAFQGVAAGVMASGAEQTVGEYNVAHIVHQYATAVVYCLQTLVDFLLLCAIVSGILHGLAGKQVQSHIKELSVAPGNATLFAVIRRTLVVGLHDVSHLFREFRHQWQQMIFLQLAEHAVDIEVVQLQIEVGSHKAGEVAVVVLLVDVEQLRVVRRHNGKSLFGQVLTECRVEVLQLLRVQQVVHVHTQTFFHFEILLHQLILAFFQTLHERCLHIGVGNEFLLVDGTQIGITPTLVILAFYALQLVVEGIHQRIIPSGRLEDAAQVGILEGIAFLCRRGIA